MSEDRGMRKVRTGIVVSDKMNKTITVLIEKKVRHRVYKKYHRVTKKYLAHDEGNTCGIGDKVTIMETRPLSRRKRWRLIEIVEKAK